MLSWFFPDVPPFLSFLFFLLPLKCMYSQRSVLRLFCSSLFILWLWSWIFMLSQFPFSNSSAPSWTHHSTEWPQRILPVLIVLDSSADLDTGDRSAPFLLFPWHVIPSFLSIFLVSSLLLCKPFLFYPNIKCSSSSGTLPFSLGTHFQLQLPGYGRLTNVYL